MRWTFDPANVTDCRFLAEISSDTRWRRSEPPSREVLETLLWITFTKARETGADTLLLAMERRGIQATELLGKAYTCADAGRHREEAATRF